MLESDLELDALLREVAADPRATMLRIARPAAFRSAFESAIAVSPHATGLTLAEREIVRTHREQLALLLRQACVARLYAHPRAAALLVRQQTADTRIELIQPAELRRRARAELSACGDDLPRLDGIELVERMACDEGSGSTDVIQLAAASMRLWPTDQARMYEASALYFDGEARAASRLYEAVIAQSSDSLIVAFAWYNLARIHLDAGTFDQALDGYRAAVDCDDSLLIALLAWLAAGLSLGSESQSLAAATRLRDVPPIPRSVIDEFARTRRLRCGAAAVDERARRTLQHLASRLDDSTKAVAHALV